MAFNFGRFNIKRLLNIANGISNPKQGINMLLTEMSKKNPEKANQLKLMISSGKNPEQALMEFAQKCEISMEQLNELKQGTSPIAIQTIYDWEHEKPSMSCLTCSRVPCKKNPLQKRGYLFV